MVLPALRINVQKSRRGAKNIPTASERFETTYHSTMKTQKVKGDIFPIAKSAIASDPYRWHTVVGIDTAKLSSGTPCPLGCGGEGDDRLHFAPSHQQDGAVSCRKENNRVYDAFDSYVAVGIASTKTEAARMILGLYGVTTGDNLNRSGLRSVCPGTSEAEAVAANRKTVTKTTKWIYCTGDGKPGYKIVRKDYSDGSKDCFQYRFQDGQYVAGMKGVALLPLNLPELNRRIDEPVYIVEGEKCCDIVSSLGLLATTASGGANSKLDWSKYVQKRHVVILPDNDKPGYRYALDVADSLWKADCAIKIVFLPDLGEGEDIADWIDRGGRGTVLKGTRRHCLSGTP